MRHHLCSVLMQMLPRFIVHHTPVQFRGLRIITLLTLMSIVALPAHDVIGNGVWRLSSVWPEFVDEAVRRILLVMIVIGIATQVTVKVETAVVPGHEGTIDGDLVQVDANPMVLGISVEEHTELEQRVWRVFDAGNHAAGAKGRLFNVAVVVFGVLVKDKATEFVHLSMLAYINEWCQKKHGN